MAGQTTRDLDERVEHERQAAEQEATSAAVETPPPEPETAEAASQPTGKPLREDNWDDSWYETSSAADGDMQALRHGLGDEESEGPRAAKIVRPEAGAAKGSKGLTARLLASAFVVVLLVVGGLVVVPRLLPPGPQEPTPPVNEPPAASGAASAQTQEPEQPEPPVTEPPVEPPVASAASAPEPQPEVEPPAEEPAQPEPPAEEGMTLPEPEVVDVPAEPETPQPEPETPGPAVEPSDPEPEAAEVAPAIPGGIWPYRAPENLLPGPPAQELMPTLAWAQKEAADHIVSVRRAYGLPASAGPRQAIAIELSEHLTRSLRKYLPPPLMIEKIEGPDGSLQDEQVRTVVFLEFFRDGKPYLFVLKRREDDKSIRIGRRGSYVLVPGRVQERTVVLDPTRKALPEPLNP
jgi:hypothetical protein